MDSFAVPTQSTAFTLHLTTSKFPDQQTVNEIKPPMNPDVGLIIRNVEFIGADCRTFANIMPYNSMSRTMTTRTADRTTTLLPWRMNFLLADSPEWSELPCMSIFEVVRFTWPHRRRFFFIAHIRIGVCTSVKFINPGRPIRIQ